MSVHPDEKGAQQPPMYEPPMQQMHQPMTQPMGQPMGQPMAPMMQQQTTTNVVVVNNQPVVENRMKLGSVYGHRDWSSGLCGCLEDGGGCLKTWCCLECTLMEISAKLNENICLVNCVPGSLIALRTRIRTLGGIRGSICKDYFALYWCGICAVCQMDRELKAMNL